MRRAAEMIELVPVLASAGRAGLGALLLRAGVNKARSPAGFATLIAGYGIFAAPFTLPVAIVLMVVECAIGTALLVGVVVPGPVSIVAGLAAASLFTLFAVAMAIALSQGRRILCGCGPDQTLLSWAGTAATAAMVPFAALCALPGPALDGPLLVQAILAGVLLLVLYDAAGQLGMIGQGGTAR